MFAGAREAADLRANSLKATHFVVKELCKLVPEALRTLSTRLPAAQLQEAASARGRLPTWLAKGLSSWAVSHA